MNLTWHHERKDNVKLYKIKCPQIKDYTSCGLLENGNLNQTNHVLTSSRTCIAQAANHKLLYQIG